MHIPMIWHAAALTCFLAASSVYSLPPKALPEGATPEVHAIVTKVTYRDGSTQQQAGSGFVIGNMFYTAAHNFGSDVGVVHRKISIAGLPVIPSAVDVVHDVAAFRLSGSLCKKICNDAVLPKHASGPAQHVAWFRDREVLEQAAVVSVAYKGAVTSGGCNDNLVYEIDAPFVPGQSGGPVFDGAHGPIVGLIQGSFERANGRQTGYFKPMRCVVERLQLSQHP